MHSKANCWLKMTHTWCAWVAAAFAVLTFLAMGQHAYAQTYTSGQTVRILFVGNSLTYYNAMPNMVAEIFRDSKPTLEIQSDLLAEGGATIRAHLDAGAVQRELRAKHYDVVVFQEVGGFPECPSDFRGCVDSPKAIAVMASLIRDSGARPIWFSTWQSSRELQASLSGSARSLADKLHLQLADVGAVLTRYADLVPGAPLLLADGHPQPLGSWVIAEVIANAIQPHVWRGFGSAMACGPDWTSIGLHIDSLASLQNAAPVRCFGISGEHVRAIQRLERRDK
jgi:hypothetical protein